MHCIDIDALEGDTDTFVKGVTTTAIRTGRHTTILETVVQNTPLLTASEVCLEEYGELQRAPDY